MSFEWAFFNSLIHCAPKRVARVMREQGLFAQRPGHRTFTTKSEPDAWVAPNLLQRDFSADQPNTKWVADTTYIWTAEGWLYVAVVLDLFSRMVGGWSMASIQDAGLVTQAPRMAVTRRHPHAGLLHHTDRGSTYTSESYQALLQHEGMVASMSRTADCYDKAAMESFFHRFKGECVDCLDQNDARALWAGAAAQRPRASPVRRAARLRWLP